MLPCGGVFVFSGRVPWGPTALSDYFVEISQDADGHNWRWEIKRRSRPLGVKLYEIGFRTPSEAQLAGEKALRQLLDLISTESDEDKDFDDS
jgi:hypothetical protein